MTSHVLTLPVMEVERACLSHPHRTAPPAACLPACLQTLTRNISALHSSIMNDTGTAAVRKRLTKKELELFMTTPTALSAVPVLTVMAPEVDA